MQLHILIIPSWYRESENDTQGSFFREQAFALAKYGCQVGVIHPQHRSMRQWKSVITGRYGFEAEDDQGIPTLRMHTMTWFPRQIPYVNAYLWVRNGLTLYRRYVEKYGQPDVIHAHGMIYGGLLAWNIQTRHNIPFVITEHGTAYARKLFAPWELKLAAKAAASANCRLAVSEAFGQELTGFLGGHWTPCPNVVSHEFTDYPLVPEKPAAAPFTFIKVAYLSERKGIHHLIAAFAKAFRHDSNTYLKIGGDGRELRRLETLATELGVADRVIFLGALNRYGVRDHMAAADAFVLSSQYETFGVVVIEALALGKPVVVTRCGGPNLVVREEDGLFVPPGDVEAMAKAMRHLKDNLYQYDAQAIRAACINRFGEAAIAKLLCEIYADILPARNSIKTLKPDYA